MQQREDQVFLLLTLLIGALVGLAVAAFILLTERLGMRLYPVGSAAWRQVLIPVLGSLGMGYLLFRYFPDARGSGVPQTKAALFARGGVITAATMFSPWPAESRWDVRDPRSKLGVGLPRCWAAGWGCAPRE
ncbi:MAG TPA: hypothetical protein VHM88_12080 [Candidatus Acidoferrales bacterium]|nr:hypothetical protein [Candidatus Acidoferrales bacterium]